jgi:hypothetical protein
MADKLKLREEEKEFERKRLSHTDQPPSICSF